jgi:hypothetical protein
LDYSKLEAIPNTVNHFVTITGEIVKIESKSPISQGINGNRLRYDIHEDGKRVRLDSGRVKNLYNELKTERINNFKNKFIISRELKELRFNDFNIRLFINKLRELDLKIYHIHQETIDNHAMLVLSTNLTLNTILDLFEVCK